MSARNLPLALLPQAVSQAQAITPQSAGAVRGRSHAHAAIQYRADIDGLRGLAVGLVVAYHAFPLFRTGGFIGVDVFFVISGYVISQVILRALRAGTFSLSDFYRRRVRRIVPALLLVLAACCLVGWYLMLPSELLWLGHSIKWCVPFLANLYFARTGGGYFEPSAELNPLMHLWSLAVEEQFYIVWPLLLALAVKRGITMHFMGGVFALSLAFSIWSAWHGTPHFYTPATRAWELAAGGILAAWQDLTPRAVIGRDAAKQAPTRLSLQAISVLGLMLIVVGGVCWTTDRAIPGSWSLLPTAGAALLLATGPHTVSGGFLASRPMVLLGKISYPLYLWHWPTLAFTLVVLGHHPSAGIASIEMGIAGLAAYGTYRLIESPIRYGRLGRKAVAPLLAGLVLLTLAGMAFDRGWIPGRLSGSLVARWNQAVNDWHYSGETKDPQTGVGMLTVASQREHKTLFIGDSHIQQYRPRLQLLIDTYPDSARSAVLAGYPGCPPLPGIPRSWPDPKCGGFFEFAIKQAGRADVDTVVFGAFWEHYFLGQYSPEGPVPHVYGLPASARVWLPLDSPEARTALERFRKAISSLVSSGRRVFIVLSNPTSPQFDPRFPPGLRLALHLPRDLPRDVTPQVDARAYEAFVAPLMDRLREIAAQTGARVLDPRSSLCAGMLCPAGDSGGFPLYLDSNHLNGVNARERASFIDPTLFGPDIQPRRP
ncbi:MAG TPA: acyltransferase family protein [Steroidobacteraceae bacterium]|nr:acyltransferase family protein [Steroidobacteraceae bacterium]